MSLRNRRDQPGAPSPDARQWIPRTARSGRLSRNTYHHKFNLGISSVLLPTRLNFSVFVIHRHSLFSMRSNLDSKFSMRLEQTRSSRSALPWRKAMNSISQQLWNASGAAGLSCLYAYNIDVHLLFYNNLILSIYLLTTNYQLITTKY